MTAPSIRLSFPKQSQEFFGVKKDDNFHPNQTRFDIEGLFRGMHFLNL